MTPAFTLCVYCGSRHGNDPAFTDVARATGHWIGAHGGHLVYGGGRNGLMGVVADAALAAGARVTGIIPASMVKKEWGHTGCTDLQVVDTMHERKRRMAEQADAFVALPGGIGTLEEFFEAWTWRQLGYHGKPVGLLNLNGYYDSLLAFLRGSVAQDFMAPWQMDLIRTGDTVPELLAGLVQDAGMAPASAVSGL